MSHHGTILGDLEGISSDLQDDKVTIRKKAADKLNDLLQNSSVIGLLNHQTNTVANSNNNPSGSPGSCAGDVGGGRIFTWNNLYRAAFRFMLKEAEKLQRECGKNGKGLAQSQG